MEDDILESVRILHVEWRAELRMLVRLVLDTRTNGDLDLRAVRACLYALGESLAAPPWRLERLHLLPLLVERAPSSRRLSRLAGDAGERERERLQELEREVTAIELFGNDRLARFEALALLFAELALVQLEAIESEAWPVARTTLDAGDRRRLAHTLATFGATASRGRERGRVPAPASAVAVRSSAQAPAAEAFARGRLLEHTARRSRPCSSEGKGLRLVSASS